MGLRVGGWVSQNPGRANLNPPPPGITKQGPGGGGGMARSGEGEKGVRGGEGGHSGPLEEGGRFWERGSHDRPVQRGWSENSDDDSRPAPPSGPGDFFSKNFFSKK